MRVDDSAKQVSPVPAAETVAWQTSIELVLKGEAHEYVPGGIDNWLQF